MKLVNSLVFVITSVFAILACWGGERWCDSFYTYRIPISFEAPAPGRYALELDPKVITDLVNREETFKFRVKSFAYPHVKVAVDGQFLDGGYALFVGEELIANGDFAKLKPNGFPEKWYFASNAALPKFAMKKAEDGRNLVTTTGGTRHAMLQSVAAKPNAWYRFYTVAKGISRPNICHSPKDKTTSIHVEGGYRDPLVSLNDFHANTYFFNTGSMEEALRVEPLEELIDDLCDEMKLHHVNRIQSHQCTLENGFVFNDLLTNFERISDHCSNIAIAMIELRDGLLDAHAYLDDLKERKDENFRLRYEEYKKKYTIDA